MAGNKTGGTKAATTNMQRHGKDFYKRIGAIGGTKSGKGGFASNKVGADGLTGRERAKLVGAAGGAKSRRGKAVKRSQTTKQDLDLAV